jgi:uncharacterized coiled-coil protein SlyX
MRSMRNGLGGPLASLVDRVRELARDGFAPTTDDVVRVEHIVLTATDARIGQEATIERLEADLAAVQRRNRRLKQQLEDLDRQIVALQSSWTWRVGRAVVNPFGRRR